MPVYINDLLHTMNSITLRNIQLKDKNAVISMLGDPDVMRFLGPGRSLTKNEANEWFKDAVEHPSRYVIASGDSDIFIGFCGIKEINGIYDFGYFISSAYWGRGIATKACKLAINKLSSQFDIEKVHVFIADENIASKRVADKLGWFITRKTKKDNIQGNYYQIVI